MVDASGCHTLQTQYAKIGTTGNMSDVAVSCGCGQWPVARVRDTMSEHEGGSARGAEARPLSRT